MSIARGKRRGAARLAALGWLVLAGCDRGPERVSAVLVTVDSLRPEALGCYGSPVAVTPNIDRIAAEGVLYTNARTAAPLTLPAHASILTGLYPLRHGVRDDTSTPLPEAAVTIAERASQAGYQTAAFVGAAILDRGWGLAQGFDHYGQLPLPSETSVTARSPERAAREVVAEARAWLAARDRRRPFLVWIHLFDPQPPFAPSPEAVERAGGNTYLAEVAAVDDAIGELARALEAEPRPQPTLFVLTSPHGEALGAHDETSHGLYGYDSTLRVPLVIRYPDRRRAGERPSDIVSVVDVAPTLLGALDLGAAPDADGIDLRGAVPVERGVYFESYQSHVRYGFSPIAGWVDAGGKYLHQTTPQFFDPIRDPAEAEDRIADGAPLDRYRRALADVAARPRLSGDVRTDAELQAALASLGYAPSATPLPEPLADTGLPDTRTRTDELQRLYTALGEGERGNLDQAIRGLERVLADNPRNRVARMWLATYLVHAERCAEAIPQLRELVRSGTAGSSSSNSLGHCLLEQGDAEKALVHFRRASQLDPTNPIPAGNVALALERLGRDDEAQLYWRRYGELGSGAGR